jgi:hypothetical protein
LFDEEADTRRTRGRVDGESPRKRSQKKVDGSREKSLGKRSSSERCFSRRCRGIGYRRAKASQERCSSARRMEESGAGS